MDRRGFFELGVDDLELGIAFLEAPMLLTRAVRMSRRRSAAIVSPTILAGSISKSSCGSSIPRTTGTFAALWPR